MDLKIIILITVSYLYGFFEIFMNLRQRNKNKGTTASDQNSLWWLYGLITVGNSLAFTIGATKIGRIYHWNAFFVTGMTLFALGLSIRIHSILTLRRFFNYTVTRVEGQRIIETGLYKFIRHPGYLGQIIIFLGISCAISNWLSILLMMIPVILGYIKRIKIEERFMQEQFGEEYVNYERRTERLIPFIY